MSVIQSNSQSGLTARSLNPNQELLGRSLNRISSATIPVHASDSPGAISMNRRLDALNSRATNATTNVQNALAYVQTAGGQLDAIEVMLSRLAALASLTQDATTDTAQSSVYQREFAAVQDELRATIGGSAAEIGGAKGVDSPKAMFNGTKLFGQGGGGTHAIDLEVEDAAGERIQVADTNLRAGGVLDLIRQDSAGNYLVSATEANAVNVVSVATDVIVSQRAAMSATESRLQLLGTSLQVQTGNLSAAISGGGSAEVATTSHPTGQVPYSRIQRQRDIRACESRTAKCAQTAARLTHRCGRPDYSSILPIIFR